jgi:hypothetical protein
MSRPLAAVVVALAIVGCGGAREPSADEVAVANAVHRWTQAVVHHDGPAACAELSSRLQEAINRHLLGEGVSGSCRNWAARWVSPRHPASRAGVRVTAVRFHGRRAVVSLAARGAPDAEVVLVNEEGRWRIDDY